MEIHTGILTLSDRSSRGDRPDLSGPALEIEIEKQGWKVVIKEILPDEFDLIKDKLIQWCDHDKLDLIITTGGTGFAPRDITPEATMSVIQRLTPGLTEAMRSNSLAITPYAMLSRSVAGIRNQTLIINMPGSPKAAIENFHVVAPVIPHALKLLKDIHSSNNEHQFKQETK